MSKFLFPIQIKAGSPTNGKVLKCSDSDGNSQWGTANAYNFIVSKTSSDNILTSESGTIFTNDTAGANITLTLPAAFPGLNYGFVNDSGFNIKVQAQSGDTIRLGLSVSAAGGYAESLDSGERLHLMAINTTEWVSFHNQWTPPV